MNETLEVLKTRRSCRKYKTEQITETELNEILESWNIFSTGTGAQCPDHRGCRGQSDPDYLSKLNANVTGGNSDPFYGAPTVLVVLADSNRRTYLEDGNMVIANLLNAAHAVGIDSCYIYRAKEVFESNEGKELLEKWGVKGDYVGIGNVMPQFWIA